MHFLLWMQAGKEPGTLHLQGRPDPGPGRHPDSGRPDHRLAKLSERGYRSVPRHLRAADLPVHHLQKRTAQLQYVKNPEHK